MDSELTFVRLHEYNHWEGEQWNWWIQLTGNEEQISKLAELLKKTEESQELNLWHTLHLEDVQPERVVDILVHYAKPGYHDSDNKVTGTFTCPDYLGPDTERLYKGGIKDFFE